MIVASSVFSEKCTLNELEDAKEILRTAPSKETDRFVDALVKLLVPGRILYPRQIVDAITLRALQSICGISGSSRTRVARSICTLPTIKQVRVIERLVRDVELLLCSLGDRKQAIQSFCDCLATVIQIVGRYDYIIYEDMAIALVQLISTESGHPIGVLCQGVIANNDILQVPFSKIQGSNGRKSIWLAAHAAGISLRPRLKEVLQVLSQRETWNKIVNPELVDALTDAVIFTSEGFGGVFDVHETQQLISTALEVLVVYEDEIPGLLPEYWLDSVLSGSDILFRAWGWRIGQQYQTMPDVGQS
ncbi:hypothetical protein FB45DRAFT_896435 [Roridomyces roridus]|uniref:Uncharacterized protein n=1 Tax=Roridomyces roridus TaxID=1738132 RepID=A0AAD7FUE9_9AGAR|nr:hypothetical protein FB45DRAFT_896435 [Roridomyces roridus]